MNQKLNQYIVGVSTEQDTISHERREILNEMIDYIKSSEEPKLHFICTHNSRRSHLSQIWAQTMADYFGIHVATFSGGTEATAFHPNAVAAIERAGFVVLATDNRNPRYQIKYAAEATPMICFSKRFDEAPNPTQEFAAIMTCSEADAECPVVFGATKRIKLFYEDPKKGDGTAHEGKLYDERCRQIAGELYYVFNVIK